MPICERYLVWTECDSGGVVAAGSDIAIAEN